MSRDQQLMTTRDCLWLKQHDGRRQWQVCQQTTGKCQSDTTQIVAHLCDVL